MRVLPIPDGGKCALVLSGSTFMTTATDPPAPDRLHPVKRRRVTVQAKQPIHNAGFDQAGHLTPWFNFPGDNAVQITTAINGIVEGAYAWKDISQTLTDTSPKIEGTLP